MLPVLLIINLHRLSSKKLQNIHKVFFRKLYFHEDNFSKKSSEIKFFVNTPRIEPRTRPFSLLPPDPQPSVLRIVVEPASNSEEEEVKENSTVSVQVHSAPETVNPGEEFPGMEENDPHSIFSSLSNTF